MGNHHSNEFDSQKFLISFESIFEQMYFYYFHNFYYIPTPYLFFGNWIFNITWQSAVVSNRKSNEWSQLFPATNYFFYFNAQEITSRTFVNFCDNVFLIIEIRLDDKSVRMEECNYLGVIFDQNLRWNKCIKFLIKKTKYLVYISYKLRKWAKLWGEFQKKITLCCSDFWLILYTKCFFGQLDRK